MDVKKIIKAYNTVFKLNLADGRSEELINQCSNGVQVRT